MLPSTQNPLYLDMHMEDGTKEQVRLDPIRDKVQLQTKLALMIRAPLLFYENDQHWKYIKDGKVTL